MKRIDEIVEKFKINNYDNFDEFYDLTKKSVYFSIKNIIKSQTLVDDLMQETYIKFLNNVDKYKTNTNVIAFITVMARNIALNEYNRRKREIIVDDYTLDSCDNERNKSEGNILDFLSKLENIETEIVSLHIINNLKFKEISKILNRPLGTILWIYNKAIKKLREMVNAYEKK